MSTSHTPGPWTAQKDIRHSANTGIITNGPLWWAIYSPSTRIARMEEPVGWLQESEQQANARLFAASPALLQAAKCALADLEGIMPEFEPSGDRAHPAWETIKELRAAIQAAEPEGS